jgi:hypothetical protein
MRRQDEYIADDSKKTESKKSKDGKVDFLWKKNKMLEGFPATEERYRAPDKATAIEFLKKKTVQEKSYFIVVETQEGLIVKDIQGVFDN